MTTNKPTLRFPAFTDNWEEKKIGEICDFIVPGRNKPTNFGGEIAWITTPDIENNIILKSKVGLSISKEEAKKVGSKIVPINSVIMSCVGELGLVAITGNQIVINQQLHAFIPKEKTISQFILYSLITQKKYMERIATKTAVPYMNKDNCNSIPIFFPSLPEQTKIANFLTAIDEKIKLLKEKKSLLEQYKKGIMQQLFNQEIRFKKDDGSEFEEWEEKSLGEVGEIIMGQSPDSKSYNTNKVGIPLIQGNADISNRFSNPRNWTSEPSKKCKVGDLILTVRAPVGSIAKSIHNACIGRGVCAIRNKGNANIEYIYQVLLDYEVKWRGLEQGSTFTAVNSNDIKSIKFNFPPLKEQQKIATFLSAIDAKIESVAQAIEATQVYKKGLLQQMFC